tara:strand:+ start:4402 stop:4725 length:324 start_codon:yes stop_codon:yes gene_type:complete
MAVGGLRHKVDLQKPTNTRDAGGGAVKTFTTLAQLYAQIKPVSGQEKYRQGQVQESVTHHVTVRYRSDIGTNMRLVYQSRNFNIRHIRNIDERNRFLLLVCNEGEAT